MHPKLKRMWMEIIVYRYTRVCEVYAITSHGRRFYRSLVYSSDARYSLYSLQPSLNDRDRPWPSVNLPRGGTWQWARHEAW